MYCYIFRLLIFGFVAFNFTLPVWAVGPRADDPRALDVERLASEYRIRPTDLWLDSTIISISTDRGAMIPVPEVVRRLQHTSPNRRELDIRCLTSEYLNNLLPSDLRELLLFLSTKQVRVRWSDREGHIRSGRLPPALKRVFKVIGVEDEVNVASALVIAMYVSNHEDLAAKMIAVATRPVLDGLKGNSKAILSTRLLNLTIYHMFWFFRTRTDLPSPDPLLLQSGFDETEIIKCSALVVKEYIHYWAREDNEKIVHFLSGITTQFRGASLPPEKVGAMLGSILSGAMQVTKDIKSKDLKKLVKVMLGVNLVANISGLIGLMGLMPGVHTYVMIVVAPVAARIACLLAGDGYAVKCGEPRDFLSSIRELQGRLELDSLLGAISYQDSCQVDRMLKVMTAAIHTNGHSG